MINRDVFKRNIELYINNQKMNFDFKYKSEQRGEIEIIFIFKKLINNGAFMFKNCMALKSVDLTSFDTSNFKDMSRMFYDCKASSINTNNFVDMSAMFS